MNVSYEWLRAFVPFEESPTQLRDLITAHIAPVDELVALRHRIPTRTIYTSPRSTPAPARCST